MSILGKSKKRKKTGRTLPQTPKYRPVPIKIPTLEKEPLCIFSTTTDPEDPSQNIHHVCFSYDTLRYVMFGRGVDYDKSKADQLQERMDALIESVPPRDRSDFIDNTLLAYETMLENTGMAHTHNAINRMDIIDIRQMSETIRTNKELQDTHMDFLFQNGSIYNIIPCFTKGALLEPSNDHVVWQIKDLNLEKNQFTIQLETYSSLYKETQETILFNNQTITVTAIPDEMNHGYTCYDIAIREKDVQDMEALISGIPLNMMNLTTAQKKWLRLIQQFYVEWSKGMKARTGQVPFMFSAMSLLHNISAVNMFLEKKAARKPSKETLAKLPDDIKQQEPAQKDPQPDKTTPGKTVRVVDMVAFSSESIPRRPTAKTVIRYLTPEWQVRGHTRRYKSGKIAYIKPHVNKRKKLREQSDSGRPQQVIRIRDNTELTESEEPS